MLIERDGRFDLDLDAIRLTEAQRAALAIDRHVVVSAGAGSGKTHTLSWRYVRLLLAHANETEQPDVQAVVVLTFTEKAAEEMAERCRNRLSLVAAHARSENLSIAARLDRLLDQFDRARIGTFHAFCARLLAENPAEGTLERDILEPEEASQLITGAAEDALEQWVRTHDDDLPFLLDTFGSRRSLLAALESGLTGSREVRERLAAHARQELEVTWDEEASSRLRHWLTREAIPLLEAVAKLTAPGRSRFARDLLPLLQPLPDEPLLLHERALAVVESVLNGAGQLRTLTHHSVLGSKASWPDARRYAQAKAALGTVMERLADWPERHEQVRVLPTPADLRLFQALVPFGRLVAEAAERVERLHRARGVVDFDRLQLDAVDAVTSDPELRARLRQRHRWLMVDEFQDTDPRQWAMVKALGDALPGEPADRVFLVGDVKQAIYGFRGGEVRLFHEAAAHLGVEPMELPDNFRSRPGLVAWFNRMFPRVMPEDWAPIVAGRDTPGAQVVWLDAEDLEEQASALCSFLRNALDTDRFGDLQAPPEPPVAILLRARTHLDLWERALRDAGIPYQIGKGVGFWAREEVVDVVNLVHAALTDDRLSWVGALRSPLLDAREEEVHAWVLGGPLPVAGVRWQQLAERREGLETVAWIRASLDALDAWRLWDADARANVRQLLDQIAGWAVPPLIVAERLLDRVQRRPRESEAMTGASRARVVVLTVHAAKGLEFPVVVVPELGKVPSGRPAPLTAARVDDTWVVATSVDDVDAEIQTRAAPSLLHRARGVLRAEQDAESGRLLYVALTRAEDHLILVGPREASERSWAGMLADPPADTLFPSVEGGADAAVPSPPIAWREERPQAPHLPGPVTLLASDLAASERCVARWYRQSRLGQRLPTPVARTLAAVRGTVIHGLIEDRVLDRADLARRRWLAAARTAGLAEAEVEAGLAAVLAQQAACAEDAVLAEALQAPGFDELALRAPFPGGRLQGRVDRLYIDRERGGFVVLDYKTAGTPDTSRHRSQLLAYGWAAGRVLEAHGQPPVVGGLLVFTALGTHARVELEADELDTVPGRLASLAALASLDHAEQVARGQPGRPCDGCAFADRCAVVRA